MFKSTLEDDVLVLVITQCNHMGKRREQTRKFGTVSLIMKVWALYKQPYRGFTSVRQERQRKITHDKGFFD